jgi:hypothetical protein
MTVRSCLAGLVLLASLGASGCGDTAPPALAAVHGRVTLRGVPLPGGLVVFTPDDETGSHGGCAQGAIGPDGRYALATGGAPGAAPGKHRVTVAGPDGWRLPESLLDPQLSGLRAEVVAGKENVLDFRLEGQ